MPVTAPPVMLGELGIDLRCRRLGNLAGGLGKGAVNTEAALVDLDGTAPDRLFGRRQRRQPAINLALDFNILPAIFIQAIEPFLIVKPINPVWIFVFVSAPWLAHLVHQTLTGRILAVAQFKR